MLDYFIAMYLNYANPTGETLVNKPVTVNVYEQLPSSEELQIYGGNIYDYAQVATEEQNTLVQQAVSNRQVQVAVPEQVLDYTVEIKNLGFYLKESSDENLNNRNALLRFQSEHNLLVDGEWDEECLEVLKLRKQNIQVTYNDTIREVPTNEKWIVINKTKRILTVYEGTTVLKKYPIAVGNPPSLTPNGKFTIVTKIVNPTWGGGGYAKPVKGGIPQNPLGYRWMGLSLNGGGDYGIHGNNKPYSIGTNASHGCVRMINIDVEGLFPSIPLKTPVWIGTEGELTEWGVIQEKYSTY